MKKQTVSFAVVVHYLSLKAYIFFLLLCFDDIFVLNQKCVAVI